MFLMSGHQNIGNGFGLFIMMRTIIKYLYSFLYFTSRANKRYSAYQKDIL